jgi:hypothetical protein
VRERKIEEITQKVIKRERERERVCEREREEKYVGR